MAKQSPWKTLSFIQCKASYNQLWWNCCSRLLIIAVVPVEILTSVNTLAVLWLRLGFRKAGLEIAGWAFLSCGFKRGSTPWSCSALGRRKGCSNVTSKPPTRPQTQCCASRERSYLWMSQMPRGHGVCDRLCICDSVCDDCKWEQYNWTAPLNMTLAIYDIKVAGHRPHATQCSVS